MLLVDKNDPQFRKWVTMVTPEYQVEQVLFGMSFLAILELLFQIYSLLKELNCFKRAAWTKEVKAAMHEVSDDSQRKAMLELYLRELREKR